MLVCETCGHENPAGASFCNACAAPLGRPDRASERRKTVTVLFCDVIGSTALGERLDPESLRRVLARYFGIEGWPIEDKLWKHAERLLPKRDIETYTQALMDLGATVCIKTPKCSACPVNRECKARKLKRTDAIPAPHRRLASASC